MEITIRFFASLREAVGSESIVCAINDTDCIADVAHTLGQKYPQYHTFSSTLVFALNGEYAKSTSRLKDGDELALIPPVSGGIND